MRKPISKHGLRRALEQAHTEGMIRWEEPTGAVVDRIWHEIEKEAYAGGRKKPVIREGVPRVEPATDGAIEL